MSKENIKAVFEMLEVEPNEVFRVILDNRETSSTKYWIDGELTVRSEFNGESGTADFSVIDLITGDIQITPIQWSPKIGERYFYVSIFTGNIFSTTFSEICGPDFMRIRLGNCYRTEGKITDADIAKWKAFSNTTDRIKWGEQNEKNSF